MLFGISLRYLGVISFCVVVFLFLTLLLLGMMWSAGEADAHTDEVFKNLTRRKKIPVG